MCCPCLRAKPFQPVIPCVALPRRRLCRVWPEDDEDEVLAFFSLVHHCTGERPAQIFNCDLVAVDKGGPATRDKHMMAPLGGGAGRGAGGGGGEGLAGCRAEAGIVQRQG